MEESTSDRLSKYGHSTNKEQIGVSIVKLILRILPVFVIVLAVIFLYNLAENSWSDMSTWEYDAITLPEHDEKYRIATQVIGDKFIVTIDYCALYRVQTALDNISTTFYCAFLPYNYVRDNSIIDKFAHTISGEDILGQTLRLKIDTSKTISPKSYFDSSVVLTNTSLSYPDVNQVMPVTMKLEFRIQYPDKTITKVLEHLYNSYFGDRTESVRLNLLSWSIDELRSDRYSKEERENIYSTWAENLWQEIEESIEKQSSYSVSAFEKLKNSLSSERVRCELKNNGPTCTSGSTITDNVNLSTYLYILSYRDPDRFSGLTAFMYNNSFPFVKKNTELNSKDNSLHFSQFPLCPIADIVNKKKNSLNIQFFLKYYQNYQSAIIRNPAFANVEEILTVDDHATLLQRENLTFGSSVDLDRNCEAFVNEGALNGKVVYSNLTGFGDAGAVKQYDDGIMTLLKRRYLSLLGSTPPIKNIPLNEYFLVSPDKDSYLSDAVFNAFFDRINLHPYKTNYYYNGQDGKTALFDIQTSLLSLYDLTAAYK